MCMDARVYCLCRALYSGDFYKEILPMMYDASIIDQDRFVMLMVCAHAFVCPERVHSLEASAVSISVLQMCNVI